MLSDPNTDQLRIGVEIWPFGEDIQGNSQGQRVSQAQQYLLINAAQTITVLKRNMAFAMDVNMPELESKYVINPNIYFNNSDLFSLLSRNVDILPEEFQEILMCKETKVP